MPVQKWSDLEPPKGDRAKPTVEPKFKAAMEVIAHTEPGKHLKSFLEAAVAQLPSKINCHGALAHNAGSRSLAAYLLMCMERQIDGRGQESKPE